MKIQHLPLIVSYILFLISGYVLLIQFHRNSMVSEHGIVLLLLAIFSMGSAIYHKKSK